MWRSDKYEYYDTKDGGSMVKNRPALLHLREAIDHAKGWAGSRDIRPMPALKLDCVV